MLFNDLDPNGTRLPVKIDSTSNGEFEPRPLSRTSRLGNTLAREQVNANAKRCGLSRRGFLVSAMGAATTLLAHNRVQAEAGNQGGWFDLPEVASLDADAALETLGKREFIFDVQGHFVNPNGDWLKKLPPDARPLAGMPKSQCGLADAPGELSYLECLSGDQFVKDVFLDSDTDLTVLSFVPSSADAEPLTIEEAAAVRDIVDKMEGHRMFLHGRVNPNQPGDLDLMDSLARDWGVVAWKCYTQYGPDGKGFWLDDDVGHIAKRYPDVNFLIYHSGYDVDTPEGPFEEGKSKNGVDTLVQSLIDNDVAPNSNVYAELGSTWRLLMQKPNEAAHMLGKLFKYVGENNVLWGTDSIWYGSPQDQIQAFRSFQISPKFQDKYGYPEITPNLRAKVFGLNALKPYNLTLNEVANMIGADKLAMARSQYQERPNPAFKTHGPRTRREFLNLLSWNGGRAT